MRAPGAGSRLGQKAKLIAATASAVTACTVAVIVFLSGEEAMIELSDVAGATDWGGPVGVLDADYRHLVTVAKIVRASASGDYAAADVRDPMVAPPGALKTRKPPSDGKANAPPKQTLPVMWLSGIIWDPENPIVMIDGQDLRVGDRIKGAKVVEIRIDSVVLSFGSKEYVLTVE